MLGALPDFADIERKLGAFQIALCGRRDAAARLAITYTVMAEWDLDAARTARNAAPIALARAHKHLTLAGHAIGNAV
jgi:hypothetical protein